MDQSQENDISMLLKQLQDNVEKSMNSEPIVEDPSTKDEDEEIDEELLKKLADLANPDDIVSSETEEKEKESSQYDISGFEFEEPTEPDEEQQTEAEVPDEQVTEEEADAIGCDLPAEMEKALESLFEPEPEPEFLGAFEEPKQPELITEEPLMEENVPNETDNADIPGDIPELIDEKDAQLPDDQPVETHKEPVEAEESEESESSGTDDDIEKEKAVLEHVRSFIEDEVDDVQIGSFFDSIQGSARQETEQQPVEENEEIIPIDTENQEEQPVLESPVNEEAAVEEAIEPSPVEQKAEPVPDIPFTNDFQRGSKAFTFFADKNEDKFGVGDLFDDTDINFALALGSKQDLENAIGFEKVRISQNDFYDPYEEDEISQAVFASAGKEYRNYDQNQSIKTRFKKEKNKVTRRFVFTLLLALVFFAMEHIGLLDLEIPYVSDFLSVPLYYYSASFVLFLVVFAISAKPILLTISDAVNMRLNSYMPVTFLSILNIAYNALLCFLYTDRGFRTYNFVLCFYILFAIADDYMHVVQESLSFDVIASSKTKLSLEKFTGPEEESDINNFKKFFVERVEFVGRFFARLDKKSHAESVCLPDFLSVLLFGLCFSILCAYKTGSLATVISDTFLCLLLTVPVTMLAYNIYPVFFLSKGLYSLDSAILGESVVDEYADADMVYLDDVEMFGQHGVNVAAIRLFADGDYQLALYYLKSLFTCIGAPLCYSLDVGNRVLPCSENVKITHIYRNGVFAKVDGSHTVAIGNASFVKKLGFNPRLNYDDVQKEEAGEMNFMYLMVDGDLWAKLYLHYSITVRFEKFASEIKENFIKIGIRSLDPCVSESMITRIRGKKHDTITVVRPSVNDLVPIGKRSDSGIVTAKNPHMIFRILSQCLKIRGLQQKERKVRILSSVLGGVIAVFVLAFGFEQFLPSIVIVAYQTLWCIIFGIMNRKNLK